MSGESVYLGQIYVRAGQAASIVVITPAPGKELVIVVRANGEVYESRAEGNKVLREAGL